MTPPSESKDDLPSSKASQDVTNESIHDGASDDGREEDAPEPNETEETTEPTEEQVMNVENQAVEQKEEGQPQAGKKKGHSEKKGEATGSDSEEEDGGGAEELASPNTDTRQELTSPDRETRSSRAAQKAEEELALFVEPVRPEVIDLCNQPELAWRSDRAAEIGEDGTMLPVEHKPVGDSLQGSAHVQTRLNANMLLREAKVLVVNVQPGPNTRQVQHEKVAELALNIGAHGWQRGSTIHLMVDKGFADQLEVMQELGAPPPPPPPPPQASI